MFARTWSRLLFAAVVIGYLAILLANLLTRIPWADEAYVANPAWNLASHGFMGTTCIEMTRSHWTRIDQHTYNTFPVGILNLAFGYKLFGFSLVTTRLPSVLWALILLYAIYRFLIALDASPAQAALSVFLLAVDYNFMIAATFARLDMMYAALGFSALAVYAVLRPRHPATAVLASCSLAALALFTHPNGLIFIPALLVVELLGFPISIPWKTAALAVVPFAIGTACWLAYVAQDFSGALDQLHSNSYPGRLTGFLHPFAAIRDEIVDRFLTAYGLTLGAHPSGPVRARGLVMLAYVSAAILAVSIQQIRNARATRITLITLALFTAYLTFCDSTRFVYYMMLVTPLYGMLLASMLTYFWNQQKRAAVATIALCLAVLQIGGVGYRAFQNPYRNNFLPAILFLQAHASQADLVFADSAFSSRYGFDRNSKEEITLGYRSGVEPSYIVVDTEMASNMKGWKDKEPAIYAYMVRRLQTYARIYNSPSYQIYRKPE